MKKPYQMILFFIAMSFSFCSSLFCEYSSYEALKEQYDLHYERPSDIHQHLPTLRRLASESCSVIELGIRNVVSSWGLFLGLVDSPCPQKSYIGVDIQKGDPEMFELAEKLCKENGISYQFYEINDLYLEIEEADLLMIDTLHTYAQLRFELEKFAPKIRQYIVMHDTTYFESWNCPSYTGDYSEYPVWINRNKRGLWPAVLDFLSSHPEWTLLERHRNNNGLTVLKRK